MEEVTHYYSRNNVPDIVKSIYYGKRLISVPGIGVNNVDQRNNEEQHRRIGLIRISGNNGVSGTNGDQRNNGEQQHGTIDLKSILRNTEDQIKNGEQHKMIDMINVSQNTRDQRNNGEKTHRSSNLISMPENSGDQRNNGEQPHKRNNLISMPENAGDQPHKRSNLINVSKSNGDQKNNGGRPHKRRRRSNKFSTKKQHGKKGSGKQKEEQFVEDKASDDHCGMCDKLAKECEFWIWCDVCERWFHGYCVGVSEEDAKSIGKFECPLCKQRQRKRHRTQ